MHYQDHKIDTINERKYQGILLLLGKEQSISESRYSL